MVLKPKAKASVDGGASGAPSIDIEIGLELRSKDAVAHGKAFIDVLDKIATAKVGASDRPVEPVKMESVTIEDAA